VAVLLTCGFEADTNTEACAVGTTSSSATLSTTSIGTLGNYSLRTTFGDGGLYGSIGLSCVPTSTTTFTRFNFFTTAGNTGGVDCIQDLITLINASVALQVSVRLVAKASSGGLFLRLWNEQGGTQIGSDSAISASTLYTVELKLIAAGTTASTVELRVSPTATWTANVVATTTTATIAATATQFIGCPSKTVNTTGGTGFTYVDDILISSTAYPGVGYNIARQIAANGNYNTWTYSTGTTMSAVVDDTPPNTTNNLSSSTSGGKFSGTVDFSLTGGTGSTGHGTGVIGTGDTINAYKIGVYGLTASTLEADQTIFRTPAGAGGADTLTTLPAWAATASYKEVLKASVPTAAQVLNHEIGVSHAASTISHTVYSIWAMADFTPAPVAAGLQPEIFRRAFSNIQKIAYIRNLLAKPPIP